MSRTDTKTQMMMKTMTNTKTGQIQLMSALNTKNGDIFIPKG